MMKEALMIKEGPAVALPMTVRIEAFALLLGMKYNRRPNLR
jgi:hypothetical protein